MRVFIAITSYPYDRISLSVIRSLSMSGVHVTVGGDRFFNQAFFSRFCKDRINYPCPSEDIDGFIESLLQHLDDKRYDVLIPVTDDNTTIAVVRNSEKFNLGLPVPDYESLIKTRDKMQTLSIARQIGIETPTTYCINDSKDLEEIADSIDYPCVLKLRESAGAIGLRFPDSSEGLKECYGNLPKSSDTVIDFSRLLIQEYIPGEVHDVCLLFNRGEPRAALTQRRIKMYPSSGGKGIFNETTDEPELRDQSIKLLTKLNWHGPAQVEFKIDSRDGTAKLMEINGRFWGTIDLSVKAGVNFPLLACKMAVDGDVNPVYDYKVGLKYRWYFPYALFNIWETHNRWHTFKEFLKSDPDTLSDFYISDSLPLLAALFYLFTNSVVNRLKHLLGYRRL